MSGTWLRFGGIRAGGNEVVGSVLLFEIGRYSDIYSLGMFEIMLNSFGRVDDHVFH